VSDMVIVALFSQKCVKIPNSTCRLKKAK
jgi:hypothetical protein